MNNYSLEPLQVYGILQDYSIFNNDDLEELNRAKKSMNHAFEYAQIFRTDTEARVSVLQDQKFPTPASKYFQSLRELSVQQEQLVQLTFDFKEYIIREELLEAQIKFLTEKLAKLENIEEKTPEDQLKEIEISCEIKTKENELDRLSFRKKMIKREALDRKREILMWDRILKELEPILENSNISIKDPNEHQLLTIAKRYVDKLNAIKTGKIQLESGEYENIIGIVQSCIQKIKSDGLEDKFINLLTDSEKLLLT